MQQGALKDANGGCFLHPGARHFVQNVGSCSARAGGAQYSEAAGQNRTAGDYAGGLVTGSDGFAVPRAPQSAQVPGGHHGRQGVVFGRQSNTTEELFGGNGFQRRLRSVASWQPSDQDSQPFYDRSLNRGSGYGADLGRPCTSVSGAHSGLGLCAASERTAGSRPVCYVPDPVSAADGTSKTWWQSNAVNAAHRSSQGRKKDTGHRSFSNSPQGGLFVPTFAPGAGLLQRSGAQNNLRLAGGPLHLDPRFNHGRRLHSGTSTQQRAHFPLGAGAKCNVSPSWTPFEYYKTYSPLQSAIAAPTNQSREQDAEEGLFDVKKYGAKGDGKTDDTDAIGDAVKAATKAGKPTKRDRNVVLFPGPGVYVFTSILVEKAEHLAVQLLDRVTLSFDVTSDAAKKVDEAAIRFHSCTDCVFEGVDKNRSYVQGNGPTAKGNCDNDYVDGSLGGGRARQFGGGGAGGEDRADRSGTLGWDSADVGGAENVPKYLVELTGQQLLVRNMSLFNSPHFHFNFWTVKQAELYNLVARAPGDSANTDGLHITAPADGVVMHDVQVCVGDDDIAMNSAHGTLNNIEIYNFDMRGGHGVSFGSSISEDITNINVHDGTLKNTMNGLRFKVKRDTDKKPKIKQIVFRNVDMNMVREAFVVENGNYGGVLFGHMRYLPRVPTKDAPVFHLSDVLICNVTGKNINVAGDISCNGACSEIVLDNVDLDAKHGWVCATGKDLDGFSGTKVTPPLKCGTKKTRLAEAPCRTLHGLAAQASFEENARFAPGSVYGDSTCASCSECRGAL